MQRMNNAGGKTQAAVIAMYPDMINMKTIPDIGDNSTMATNVRGVSKAGSISHACLINQSLVPVDL